MSPKSNTVSYAYCKLPIHTISECRKLKQKQDKDKPQSSVNANSFASLSPVKCPVLHITQSKDAEQPVYPHFAPYCKTATIVRQDGSHRQIRTLQDTGAMQSLLKGNPGSNDYIHAGESRQIKGITNQVIAVPLVEVHLRTIFLNETVFLWTSK